MRITPELIRNILKRRLLKLEKIKKNRENSLKRAPEGKLRISSSKGRPQYYCRYEKSDKNGIYIPQKDIVMARRLGQKDYDQETLDSVQTEILIIKRFLANYPDVAAEEVFQSLPLLKRDLICPFEMTDEMFVEAWLSKEYERKEFRKTDEGFSTDHGEIVRSKSEWIIANLLEKYAVPYRYEAALYLPGMGIIHPDFTTLNVRLREERYWEHEGMMDNPEYAERAIQRERVYIKNGYLPGDKLILTSETARQPLNPEIVKWMIEKYCL